MSPVVASIGRLAIADQDRGSGANPKPPRPRRIIAQPDAVLVPEQR